MEMEMEMEMEMKILTLHNVRPEVFLISYKKVRG